MRSPSESAPAEGVETPGAKPASFGHNQLEAGQVCWRETHDLRRAMGHFDAAMQWALEHGASELWDRAFCNRCALEIEAGEAHDSLGELREIVLRSRDAETGFLAAYNLAHAYDLGGDSKKAKFYATLARDRSLRLERQEWRSWSFNQMGNLLLAASEFEDACAEYENALRCVTDDQKVDRALILDNLGYCRLMQGRHSEAFPLLFSSLRTFVRAGLVRPQVYARLSLCYAYLDLGRLRSALRHGQRALEIATECDDLDSVKHALFLLGETHNQLGNEETALGLFDQLQQRFYPDSPNIPDVLMAIDVRQLVNLRA